MKRGHLQAAAVEDMDELLTDLFVREELPDACLSGPFKSSLQKALKKLEQCALLARLTSATIVCGLALGACKSEAGRANAC